MKTNKYLNNNVFELRLPHPLKYKGVMELKEEDFRLGGDIYHFVGDDLILRQGDTYICIDTKAKSIKWTKKPDPGVVDFYFISQYQNYYIFCCDDNILYWNIETGKEKKRLIKGEYISKIIGDYILTYNIEFTIFTVRDIKNLEILWHFESSNISLSTRTSDENLLIVESDDSMHVFKLKTGELLWQMEIQPWIKQRFPEETRVYYLDPSIPNDYPIKKAFGPLLNNIQYMCWCGYITALDAQKGKELWSWKMPPDPDYEFMATPSVPPFGKDGKLYVMQNYSGKGNNRIFCLDANTGDFIYESDLGIFNVDYMKGFMAGDEIIVTNKGKVIAYDVNKRAISWQFESDDTTFDGDVIPYYKGLIVIWSEFKKIFWYDAD
jgi:outer membrane protein assembly factor BamB